MAGKLYLFALASHAIALAAVALAIMVKICYLNDIDDTFRQDPLDLWVGLGVAMLMIDRLLGRHSNALSDPSSNATSAEGL